MANIDLFDDIIRRRLAEFASRDSEFWSFRNTSSRDYTHAYLQYPAMMVPQMQRIIMQCICENVPGIRKVFDPFVGSGTTMTEAMLGGLDFMGYDINPLAVLVCRAKAGPFSGAEIEDATARLSATINADTSEKVDNCLPYLDKWLRSDVSIELSRIRRAIRSLDELWCRRFFWVALAETVRLSTNSRTSTFKLHKRPADEIMRDINPLDTFNKVISANLKKLRDMRISLAKKNLLKANTYIGQVIIEQRNLLESSTEAGYDEASDILVTSPPYGDNATTVPYGQYSYLPLQWIDLQDIDPSIDESFLMSTHEIDSRSMGGSLRNAISDVIELREVSPTLNRTLMGLENEPRDRAVRVAAFCRDLNLSMDFILSKLASNAYMIWTIGNRRVGGQVVPTDDIILELLAVRGAKLVHRFERVIPSKRMAVKNNIAETMMAETILILRKGNERD